MTWKLIGLVLVVFALSLHAAYRAGGYFTNQVDVEQCNSNRASDKAQYAAGQVQAADAARDAQKQVDAAFLAETQRLLADARAEAVTAQKSASEAKARFDSLNREYARLKNENPDVKAWNDSCLPSSLLRSLHGTENPPAGRACR